MHPRTLSLIALAAVLAAPNASSQSASPIEGPRISGKTAIECMDGANDWLTTTWDATPARSQTSALNIALHTEARRVAAQCGAKLQLDKAPGKQLRGLIDYYRFLGDTAGVRTTLDRALVAKDLPPRDRALVLDEAVRREITRAASATGVLDAAERYVAAVDALPDSLSDLKVAPHQTMLGQYEYLNVDAGIQSHASALLVLGHRTGKQDAIVRANLGLARAAADMLRPDDALAFVTAAERDLTPASKFTAAVKDARQRYALIGTTAPAITAQWWLNAGAQSDAVQPGNGTVMLIAFTAHWCVPCHTSYPSLRDLAARLDGKRFDGVLVTGLYGYVGRLKNLTPEQEVAADREYYATGQQLPFRIAINPPANRSAPADGTSQSPDQAYHVSGLPQIMIVDKTGVIRQIVIGWDPANTDRLARLIDQMLSER
jgi:hypothetical protein